MRKRLNRYVGCPKCGYSQKIPWGWILGVEMVFRCSQCGYHFKTGFKMGAALFGFALALALTTANIGIWLFSSYSTLFFFFTIAPLWILYGFIFRKWWMIRKNRKFKLTLQEKTE